jgi:hypothetical protein
MSVSYPKIGVLLAEFQSVFSIVLILGLLLRILSEYFGNDQISKVVARRIFPAADEK